MLENIPGGNMKNRRSHERKNFHPFYKSFGLERHPFQTRPLSEKDMALFIGREKEVSDLELLLSSFSNVAVCGEAGSGKSTLLKKAALSAKGVFEVLWVGAATDRLEDFLARFEEALDHQERRKGTRARSGGGGLSLRRMKKRLEKFSKPLWVFLDDVDKIHGDVQRHLTRADRTQQFLEEIRPLLQVPRAAFAVSLQEEFYGRASRFVADKSENSVLGLFEKVVLLGRLSREQLKTLFESRLKKSGWKGSWEDFLEPEALTLALSLAAGNPRRFLYVLGEGCFSAIRRSGRRVEFSDLLAGLQEHLDLDAVMRKILYFLAKTGRGRPNDPDLQAFCSRDSASLARRFDLLAKRRLVEMASVCENGPVYALSGFAVPPGSASPPDIRVERSSQGEPIWILQEETNA